MSYHSHRKSKAKLSCDLLSLTDSLHTQGAVQLSRTELTIVLVAYVPEKCCNFALLSKQRSPQGISKANFLNQLLVAIY